MKTLDQTPVDLEVKVYEVLSVYRTHFTYHLFKKNGFDLAWYFINESSVGTALSEFRLGLTIISKIHAGETIFRVDSLDTITTESRILILRSTRYRVRENA